jgi:hypothetical protein
MSREYKFKEILKIGNIELLREVYDKIIYRNSLIDKNEYIKLYQQILNLILKKFYSNDPYYNIESTNLYYELDIIFILSKKIYENTTIDDDTRMKITEYKLESLKKAINVLKYKRYNSTDYDIGIQKAIEIFKHFNEINEIDENYDSDGSLYNGGGRSSYKIIKVIKKYKKNLRK